MAIDLQAHQGRVQDHRAGLGRHDPRAQGRQVRRHHGRHVDHRRAQEGDRLLRPLRRRARRLRAAAISPLAKLPDHGKVINLDKDKAEGDAALKECCGRRFKGKTLGVQVSTTHATFVGENFKDVADIKEYKTTDERDLDLKSGRIDAELDDADRHRLDARKPDAKDFAISARK